MEELWKYLTEPDEELFFSRNDPHDKRLGDIVLRGRKNFSGELQIGILGVPEDEGVKRNRGRAGARGGPDEIRRAFYRLTPYHFGSTEHVALLKIFDLGNLKIKGSLEDVHATLESVVETLTRQHLILIVLGGGHDISYPNFLGFAKHKASAGLINIDSHLDVREPNPDRNSGTSFRMILEHPNSTLLPQNFVEIGIQSYLNSIAHYDYVLEKGGTIFTHQEIREDGIEKIIPIACEIAGNLTEGIFVSFDMDAVRSADAPGVSSSSPTGLTAEQILQLASFAGKEKKVTMIDICEVNPKYDIDGQTAKLAAQVMMNFLIGVANR